MAPQIEPKDKKSLGLPVLLLWVLLGWVAPLAAEPSCTGSLGNPTQHIDALDIHGTLPATALLAVTSGDSYLLEVREQGNDALVEVLDSEGHVRVSADHPERRSGTRHLIVTPSGARPWQVRITGKENPPLAGRAAVRIFPVAALRGSPGCIDIFKQLAGADADYASGQEISRGRAAAPWQSARQAYARAAAGYADAERALVAPGDRALQGEAALALAALAYLDLQDWVQAADWARTASVRLQPVDAYRSARADALAAAAWMEIAVATPAAELVPGFGVSSKELLTRARDEQTRLQHFHRVRGERYDAALQLTNIGLTYLYEGHYPECIRAFVGSGQLFGALQERQRQAQAWQNRALCLWGLGRLPEALPWFEHALAVIGPEPYPRYFVTVTTNTALADYALGHFDEALRLYDQALPWTQKTQAPRDEGFCLYGIGMTYYALGDRGRARDYLERSLAIRSVALDGRGRMASLRALATIEADQGHPEQALALDREALALALAPSAVERLKIQLAVHTAAAGDPQQAITQLDALLTDATAADPLVHAEAQLQRAVLLRKSGRLPAALSDLQSARSRFHRFGRIAEEFAAGLERGRTLRALGRAAEARVALDQAIGLSEAVRLQSANPELRSLLQAPLRAAYDEKITLLWAQYQDAGRAGRHTEMNALAATAFVTADAARARTFADVAAQKYPPEVRQALAADFKRREALYAELAARRFALDERLERSGAEDARAHYLSNDIADLERQADTLNTRIAARSLTAAGRHRLQEPGRVPEVPTATALMSFWLGSEAAYAWVVRPDEIHWVQLGDPRALTEAATGFYRALTHLVDVPLQSRLAGGSSLSMLVLRPLAPWISQLPQWVIIPDGALDYVPFAALRFNDGSGEQFVAVQHDVALTPAAWMLNETPQHSAAHSAARLLLVADPVYQADDPRLRGVLSSLPASPIRPGSVPRVSQRSYERLPFTAREAAAVAALFPAGDVEQLTGLNATREELLRRDWSGFRYLHIATHGVVDLEIPQLSALILGAYNARGQSVASEVRVADLSLQTLDADVAVFSACQTAVGKQIPSEGLVGIASTALARGARSVVASLWTVSDEMGSRLMTEFYRHLLRDAASPPAALGEAMRAVIGHDPSADPALWAAFQVEVVTLGSGLSKRTATAQTAVKEHQAF